MADCCRGGRGERGSGGTRRGAKGDLAAARGRPAAAAAERDLGGSIDYILYVFRWVQISHSRSNETRTKLHLETAVRVIFFKLTQ